VGRSGLLRLTGVGEVTPVLLQPVRYFYNRFVRHWPDLEGWFAEPLLVRLDLHDRDYWQSGKRKGPSHEAGTYLAYLSLVHRLPLDADWLLSRNFDGMFHPQVAAGLGLDLLIAYSKRLDLLSALLSAVERLRAKDADEPETGRSVRSEQAPRVWRVSDRLSEADLCSLASGYLAGSTARELAERFKISKSSVKRLLRERGIRRTAFVA